MVPEIIKKSVVFKWLCASMHIKHIEALMHINYTEASVHIMCDNIIILDFYSGHVINTQRFFKYNNNTNSLNKIIAPVLYM
jgi:hypothetical protein